VRKYPQWAYLPYKPMKEFMNPYIVKNKACDDIEDKFEENYKTLENLIGKENFDEKMKSLGIYTGR